MIRVVFDTNIIVSGYLWSGAPRSAINVVLEGRAKLLASEALIDELKDVLSRPKFAKRLDIVAQTAEQIVVDHLKHLEIVEVTPIPLTIKADPDDDMVLACAVSGKADFIVSGDPHLLEQQSFRNIPIITVNAFLEHTAYDPPKSD